MPTRTDSVLGGRYRLGTLLGRGGMAEVYSAHDQRLDRAVAVKVLRPAMASHEEIRRRFDAEARAAASLSHPNVVAVFDTGEDETADGRVSWIVMERLPGATLADRLAEGPLEVDAVTRVAGDVLGALGAAHDAGILHRDIKPGNILLAADGCAKVGDFGIAKSLELAEDLTSTGQLVGTPAYLAPERIEGRSATVATDLYAVGVVLYEALAGRKPFQGTTPVSVAYAVRHTPVQPLAELRPDAPPALVAAVQRAMARDPGQRFASAGEMAEALRCGLSGAPEDASSLAEDADATLVLSPAPSSPVRSRIRRRALAAIAVILISALVVGFAVRGGDDVSAGPGGELRDLAADLGVESGARWAEAAARLRSIADVLETRPPDAEAPAEELLADLAQWQSSGQLSSGAAARARDALVALPGVDPAAFTTTTTAVAPPREEDQARPVADGEDRPKRGKGRKGGGDDD
ncbi:MAG TPA: protein kinase [Acidimicrobiales bacterium]|nr:protein kinase [Acidimicrobiales bacterium]